jgi:uncharacterized protein
MRTIILGVVALVLCSGASWAADPLPLVDAARRGDAAAVRALLRRQPAVVNVAAADGMTALHYAVRANDAAMVQALLRAKADVKVATRYGVTPLALAAQNGSAEMIELLAKAGADVNAQALDAQTPLMIAARTGSAAAIKALVARGATVKVKDAWMEETPLSWAAAENHPQAVAALLELGADPNARSKVLSFPEFRWVTSGMVSTALPRGGWTPLMHAARQGAIDGARALAEGGADLNIKDPDGTTALVIAIINAHYDVAAMLLEKGADPNIADTSGMAAVYALVDMNTLANMQGRPQPRLESKITPDALLQLLIKKGGNPNARLLRPTIGRYHGSGDATLGEGSTPLLRAAKTVDLEMLKVLLQNGADATLTKKDRTTALITVAGGQPRLPDPDGARTIEAMQLLLARGVDIDAFNTTGQTAVHAAAGRGADPVVKFLASKGATLSLPDKQGRTPLDVALGVGAGGGRNAARNGPTVRDSTATLLRQLMAEKSASR